MKATLGERLQQIATPILYSGLALNLGWIGRLKYEQYEVENIRPLIVSSPLFSMMLTKLGEQNLARVVGATEMVTAAMIAARPAAPRVAAAGSLGAVGIFAITLSFLATTPEAWQPRRREPKLSPAGQFLVKDVVLFAAALLAAADSLEAARRR